MTSPLGGHLDIRRDADGALADWFHESAIMDHFTTESSDLRLVYISKGMKSGAPAVMLAARRKGGKRYAVLELSAALLVSGAAAIKEWAKQEGFDL